MTPHEKNSLRGRQWSSKLLQKLQAEQAPPAFEALIDSPEINEADAHLVSECANLGIIGTVITHQGRTDGEVCGECLWRGEMLAATLPFDIGGCADMRAVARIQDSLMRRAVQSVKDQIQAREAG